MRSEPEHCSLRAGSPRRLRNMLGGLPFVALCAIASVACGGAPDGSVTTARRAGEPADVGCPYSGALRGAVLSTTEGAWSAVALENAHVTAMLHRAPSGETPSPLRLDANARVGGYELVGQLGHGALTLREAAYFGPLVLLPAGSSPAFESMESGRVRAVLPPAHGGGDFFPRVSFRQRPEASLGCDALELRAQVHSFEDLRALARAALGEPTQGSLVRVIGDEPLGLAATTEGPVLALHDVSRGNGAIATLTYARVIEAGPVSSRVIFEDWRGATLVAWVPSARLEAHESGGLGGLLGTLSGSPGDETINTYPVCTSGVDLPLVAVRANGTTEAVGVIHPGQRFVRGERHAEGHIEMAPHPRDPLSVVDHVSLWIREAPLTCDSLAPVYGQSLQRLATSPPLDLRARFTVLEASGLEAVSVGAGCELSADYRPSRPFLSCRIEVRCGETSLFGTRPSNGYLTCDVVAGTEPSLSGEDTQTTDPSNDPALRVDTRAGTLEIRDDASGEHGAFTLRARLESIEATAPVPVAD